MFETQRSLMIATHAYPCPESRYHGAFSSRVASDKLTLSHLISVQVPEFSFAIHAKSRLLTLSTVLAFTCCIPWNQLHISKEITSHLPLRSQRLYPSLNFCFTPSPIPATKASQFPPIICLYPPITRPKLLLTSAYSALLMGNPATASK